MTRDQSAACESAHAAQVAFVPVAKMIQAEVKVSGVCDICTILLGKCAPM